MSSMEETMERVYRRVPARGLNPIQRRGPGSAGCGVERLPGPARCCWQGQAEPAEPLPTRARRDVLRGEGPRGFLSGFFLSVHSMPVRVGHGGGGLAAEHTPWLEFIWDSVDLGCTMPCLHQWTPPAHPCLGGLLEPGRAACLGNAFLPHHPGSSSAGANGGISPAQFKDKREPTDSPLP